MRNKEKYTKWTPKKLNEFFEDNMIEDDNLFECLKNREAILEFETNDGEDKKGVWTEFTIKIKMREL